MKVLIPVHAASRNRWRLWCVVVVVVPLRLGSTIDADVVNDCGISANRERERRLRVETRIRGRPRDGEGDSRRGIRVRPWGGFGDLELPHSRWSRRAARVHRVARVRAAEVASADIRRRGVDVLAARRSYPGGRCRRLAESRNRNREHDSNEHAEHRGPGCLSMPPIARTNLLCHPLSFVRSDLVENRTSTLGSRPRDST
jgi:hypothetical protein